MTTQAALPIGWCDFADVYRHWLRVLPDNAVVVEVGSYLGQSAISWGVMARALGRHIPLQCVDPFLGVDEANIVTAEFKAEQRRILRECGGSMRPAFDHNVAIAGVSDWVSATTTTSVEAAATYAPESVDRVMVDGDHAAASVRADLDAWWPVLKPGGELVGHDDDWPSVHRTVRAWAAERGLTVLPVSARCWRIIKPSGQPVTWDVPAGARICLVAVCSNERTIYTSTVKSLLALGWGGQVAKAMRAHGFTDIRFAWFDKGHVDVMRESAALAALNGLYSHILFLDADMTWPETLLVDLLKHHDQGIVSGLYHLKPWPHKPVAFKGVAFNPVSQNNDYTFDEAAPLEESLRPQDLIGMGCALVPVRVFETLPRPWFKYQTDASTGLATVSEDVWFCEQARAAGVPIWLDPTISCGHITSHQVTSQDFFRAMFDAAHIEAGTTPALPTKGPRPVEVRA